MSTTAITTAEALRYIKKLTAEVDEKMKAEMLVRLIAEVQAIAVMGLGDHSVDGKARENINRKRPRRD